MMARDTAEVGMGWLHIVQALVASSVLVMLDEGPDLGLDAAEQEVVFQQDAIFQRPVPTVNLALYLQVRRRAASIARLVGLEEIL